MTMLHDHGAHPVAVAGAARVALVGAPNAGKTTLFNALTGLRARTANYPGVTVSRSVGTCGDLVVEDLPGTYGLAPVSPDERIVVDVLAGRADGVARPDAVVIVVDATTLRRSLPLVARLLSLGQPASLALTFTDELARRHGLLDSAALARAIGVPVVVGAAALRRSLPRWRTWPTPVIAPPTRPEEVAAWADSVLAFAHYRSPQPDRVSNRIDDVILHPIAGPIVFVVVMLAFFEAIFTIAAPLQSGLTAAVDALGEVVAAHVRQPWLAGLLGDALIGGVGGVLVFLPQIVILFLLISILEGVGYLARAAFVMDRLMARFGLEGRAFVALLSSVACAVPGIMATRTLPSARDRVATMMAAPLMTCSARLPVYVMLVGLLVRDPVRRGAAMFGLYLLGALSALVAAWVFQRHHPGSTFFHMEIPPYRWPSVRSVALSTWDSAMMFLRKCSTIILGTSVGLWLLLNLPPGRGVDHSLGAGLGHLVAPVFAPLGFDWRVSVGILSAQAARETFIATLTQVGPVTLAPATIVAILVYFVFALQCMSTVAALRRETGGWRWPAVAFSYLTGLGWVMALLAHTVVVLA